MNWKELSIYFIDFEGSLKSGIIEYGVACLSRGKVVSAEGGLCMPTGEISPIETAQHGLRSDALQKYLPFETHFFKFVEFRKQGLLGAHNAHVEKNLLRDIESFPGMVPSFASNEQICSWGPWIDTLCLYRRCYPSLASYKLSDLVKVFELEDELSVLANQYCTPNRARYHCALYDALASALLAKRLFLLPEFEEMTVDWLVSHASSEKNPSQSEFDL